MLLGSDYKRAVGATVWAGHGKKRATPKEAETLPEASDVGNRRKRKRKEAGHKRMDRRHDADEL